MGYTFLPIRPECHPQCPTSVASVPRYPHRYVTLKTVNEVVGWVWWVGEWVVVEVVECSCAEPQLWVTHTPAAPVLSPLCKSSSLLQPRRRDGGPALRWAPHDPFSNPTTPMPQPVP